MSAITLSDYVSALTRSELCEASAAKAACDEYLRTTDPPRRSAESLADFLASRSLLTPWQNSQLLQGRYKGFLLGKYKLLDQLGRGGMAGVYLAEDSLLLRKVALKIMPKLHASGATSHLARFQREAKALAMLNHRNIVRVYDIDVHGDMHYIAMEFIRGQDLQRIVADRGPLDSIAAADYIAQAAAGLAHAHERQLVHRDIKPANLMLDEQGVVKLLDLGVARLGDEETSLTVLHDDRMLGTADFIAPEQALDSHNVGPAADVYSLGCTLYFLLTGRAPFHTGTAAERLLAHQMKPAPDVRGERARLGLAAIDDRLVEFCTQMIAKSPADRPTAATLQTALASVADRAASAASSSSKPPASQTAKPPAKSAANASATTKTKSTANTANHFATLETLAESSSEPALRLETRSKTSSRRVRKKSRHAVLIVAGTVAILLATVAAGGVMFGVQALREAPPAETVAQTTAKPSVDKHVSELPASEPATTPAAEPKATPVAEMPAESVAEVTLSPPAASGDGVKYYVVGNGKKYHRAGCRHLTSSAREISAAEAKADYQPCKVCKPAL